MQEGIDEGVFRPVNVQMTALSLLGTLHAFVTYQTFIADGEFEEDIGGHVWNLFLHGIIHPQ
ncbi:MAG: hypothetical protein IPK16_14890 [Anaerolineales bacterium]|nr:hypothetical protein [Anaerolineales bacterium]